jgi:hypothetical protein
MHNDQFSWASNSSLFYTLGWLALAPLLSGTAIFRLEADNGTLCGDAITGAH